MAYIYAQERVRLCIERQFVVSIHAHYKLVDVNLALIYVDARFLIGIPSICMLCFNIVCVFIT